MYQKIPLETIKNRDEADALINDIKVLKMALNINDDIFHGLFEWTENEVIRNNYASTLVWNSLVDFYNELTIRWRQRQAMQMNDPMEMGGVRKKCRRSLVNGHMLLRNKKGRFCKKKSMKRK